MITKRTNLLAGSLLGGALLLGTAGLALAQDPAPTPTTESPGGMMNGRGMAAGQGMMNGRGMAAGQMPDMTAMHAAMGKGAGQGMMNGQGMGAGQMPDMNAMHDQAQPGN